MGLRYAKKLRAPEGHRPMDCFVYNVLAALRLCFRSPCDAMTKAAPLGLPAALPAGIASNDDPFHIVLKCGRYSVTLPSLHPTASSVICHQPALLKAGENNRM